MNLKKALVNNKKIITTPEEAWKHQRYLGYKNPKLKDIAQKYADDLTSRETKAEKWIGCILKELNIEAKFQQPILTASTRFSFYILDCYIPSIHLIIELDGSQHFTKEGMAKDKKRDRLLKKLGFKKTLRLKNSDALMLTKDRLEILLQRV